MGAMGRPVFDFSPASREAVAGAYSAAVACGSDFTGTTREEERACSAQDLLCMAGAAALDVAMIAQRFEASRTAAGNARMMRTAAAGLARLSARALEVHARDTGYDPGAWIERAGEQTGFLLFDDFDPLRDGRRDDGESIVLARAAASAVLTALALAPVDRMGVSEQIAEAIGASVALFMIADAAG